MFASSNMSNIPRLCLKNQAPLCRITKPKLSNNKNYRTNRSIESNIYRYILIYTIKFELKKKKNLQLLFIPRSLFSIHFSQ